MIEDSVTTEVHEDETTDLAHIRSAEMPTALLVIHGPDGGKVVSLNAGTTCVVGRGSEADILVDEGSLSRIHAKLSVEDGVVTVEDLGSHNGTKLNGQIVTSAEVGPGDELSFGSVLAIVLQPEAPSRWLPAASTKAGAQEPIVRSDSMVVLFESIDRFADANLPVLVQGETGSGKEVVARALHERSSRRDQPMAAINCGAISSQLVEDTLFGHERGAFTGAHDQARGVFENASGGTVLLDEIAELPASAQVALLRVLETRQITRIGSPKEISVDVRVIAATNRNLEQMCEEGTFRWDLFYRLNAITLKVPPLRHRREEIGPLADRFSRSVEARFRALGIAPGALALLEAYHWPGNVRELANVVQRAAVMASGRNIEPRDLPDRISAVVHEESPQAFALAGDALPDEEQVALTIQLDGRVSFKERLTQAETQIIVHALEQSNWSQTEAAKQLRMPLRTLVHKLKKLGIQPLVSRKRSEAASD